MGWLYRERKGTEKRTGRKGRREEELNLGGEGVRVIGFKGDRPPPPVATYDRHKRLGDRSKGCK